MNINQNFINSRNFHFLSNFQCIIKKSDIVSATVTTILSPDGYFDFQKSVSTIFPNIQK